MPAPGIANTNGYTPQGQKTTPSADGASFRSDFGSRFRAVRKAFGGNAARNGAGITGEGLNIDGGMAYS